MITHFDRWTPEFSLENQKPLKPFAKKSNFCVIGYERGDKDSIDKAIKRLKELRKECDGR